MFSDAIIEPFQKTFAFKGCKITVRKKLVFLEVFPYKQDFFGNGATISMRCLPYVGFFIV